MHRLRIPIRNYSIMLLVSLLWTFSSPTFSYFLRSAGPPVEKKSVPLSSPSPPPLSPPPCNPGRCPAPPHLLQQDNNLQYHVTVGMSLDAPDATQLLPEREQTSHSLDDSNFAALTFRLLLRQCGQGKNAALVGKENIFIYRARLVDIETRCNDISGVLEASSDSETNIKMAKAMDMCSQYPLFVSGPSSQWFSVAMRGTEVLGIDFPAEDQSASDPGGKKLIDVDHSFKTHAIRDLLFATPATVCLPALDLVQCAGIDRNQTLLLTTKKSDEHDGAAAGGTIATASKMKEKVSRKTVCSYEINNHAMLSRTNCFETAEFQTEPLELDSIQPVVRRATLKTRWEAVRETRAKKSDMTDKTRWEAVRETRAKKSDMLSCSGT